MTERFERINMMIQHLGLTKNSLATSCGLAPSNLNKMLNGEQTITDKTLHKIAESYPQINVEWLKTGEGEMLNPIPAIQGNGNVVQDGRGGRNLTQTNNSDQILTKFIEGLESQNKLTEKAMSQTELSMAQTDHAMEQTNKALDEISEQRKLVDRLISIIEMKSGPKL